MPLIQTYQSGATDKRAEVHKDMNTGDYSVKHFQSGAAVRQIPVPGGQDPHMIAKSYVSETLVQTYQSGETNRRSEVHKDPNTGDYSVKHYHHGAAVKHVKVSGDQDPHTIAKRYIKEQTCPVCGSKTKAKALRCKGCITESLKAAQAHQAKIDYNDPSTHRHADASTEHLLAMALKQRGDHENASKASERAKRFSKALKEAYKIISYGSGAKHKVIHNGATIAQGMTLDQAKAHVKERKAKAAMQKAAFNGVGPGEASPHNVVNEDGAAVGAGAPTNNVGSGAVAGLGVGPQGEPGRKKSRVMKVLRRAKP